jgi:hypothetical protein
MQECPYCKNVLSEKSIFCSKCGKQARCKNSECRELLGLEASFCDLCGTPVGESKTATGQSASSGNTQLPVPGYNTIHLEEDKKSLTLHTVLSDEGLANLSNPLSMIIANRMGIIGNRGQRPPITKDIIIDDPRLLLNSGAQDNGTAGGEQDSQESVEEAGTQSDNPASTIPPTPEGTNDERLKDIFPLINGKLQLDEPDIKADSKLDYARRLTYLFLYAHKVRGTDQVPRSDLTTVLEDNSVNDGNARYWISKSSALVTEGENIRLNNAGRRLAREALRDILAPTKTEQGWLPGETTSTRGSKGSAEGGEKKSKGGGSRKSTGRSKAVTDWVSKWKGLNWSVDGHKILKDKNTLDRAIFGLWAIRHVMGDAGKVVSRHNLSTFILEAFEYKVNERSLENALKSKNAAGKVIHVEGTKFQIQPTGIDYAKQMVGINETAAAASVSKGTTKKK